MILDTVITKVGSSFYILIPAELRKLFNIENGTKGTIEVKEDGITINFKLEDVKNDERDTIREED